MVGQSGVVFKLIRRSRLILVKVEKQLLENLFIFNLRQEDEKVRDILALIIS